jgi:hypothetical protein
MLTGHKGDKRPADVIGNAVHVMKVLTGEAAHAPLHAPDERPLKEGRQSRAHGRALHAVL